MLSFFYFCVLVKKMKICNSYETESFFFYLDTGKCLAILFALILVL